MSPNIKSVVVYAAIAGVVAFVLSFIAAAMGIQLPTMALVVPLVAVGAIIGTLRKGLAGNRSERRLDGAERTTALGLQPAANEAIVVLEREGFAGKALGIDVVVDGTPRVQMRSPRAAVLRLAPGEHTFNAVIPSQLSGPANPPLVLTLASGEVLFLDVAMVMGATRNTAKIERAADPGRARQKLASLPLLATEAVP